MIDPNTHYIPDPSDLCVGYQCQIYTGWSYLVDHKVNTPTEKPEYWLDHTLVGADFSDDSTPVLHRLPSPPIGLSVNMDANTLRVPYLTKDQVESEGWEDSHFPIDDDGKDEYVDGYEINHPDYTEDLPNWYTLRLLPDHRISIEHRYYRNAVGQSWYTLFEGYCPSVNELRRIMKMVGIKKPETTNA